MEARALGVLLVSIRLSHRLCASLVAKGDSWMKKAPLPNLRASHACPGDMYPQWDPATQAIASLVLLAFISLCRGSRRALLA